MGLIKLSFEEHNKLVGATYESCKKAIEQAAQLLVETLKNGNKILIFGNGGSAADAQHIAAELVGRFVKERKGLAAIALSTDTSALTAIANDYGYENIFSRQVEALANKGDVCIGISTSGNSENVFRGLQKAQVKGCQTVTLLGKDGGKIQELSNTNIIIPSNITARIQEMHILIGHILCDIIDIDY